MKQVIAKQTQCIIYGDSDYARFIFARLKEKTKDITLLGKNDELRFVAGNVASINGTKTSFKKALVELPTQAQPLPLKSAKSVVVVGVESSSVVNVLDNLTAGKDITLLVSGSTLVPSHDSAVQDVMQRYFKKMKVTIHYETDVLSVNIKDQKYFIVAEHKGQPKRMVSDRLITEEVLEKVDYGLENAVSKVELHSSDRSHSLNESIAVLKLEQQLSLADVDTIVGYMCGRRSIFAIDTPRTQIHSAGGVSFFSIGLVEQAVTGAHTGYRKSVIKLPRPNPSSPTYFIKILASINGRILGISGIAKQDTLDIDLLYHFVSTKVRIKDAKIALSVSTPNAASLHDALDSL